MSHKMMSCRMNTCTGSSESMSWVWPDLKCMASEVGYLPPACTPSHALRSHLHLLQVLFGVPGCSSCSSKCGLVLLPSCCFQHLLLFPTGTITRCSSTKIVNSCRHAELRWLQQLQQQVRPCALAELLLLEPPALPYKHHFRVLS